MARTHYAYLFSLFLLICAMHLNRFFGFEKWRRSPSVSAYWTMQFSSNSIPHSVIQSIVPMPFGWHFTGKSDQIWCLLYNDTNRKRLTNKVMPMVYSCACACVCVYNVKNERSAIATFTNTTLSYIYTIMHTKSQTAQKRNLMTGCDDDGSDDN